MELLRRLPGLRSDQRKACSGRPRHLSFLVRGEAAAMLQRCKCRTNVFVVTVVMAEDVVVVVVVASPSEVEAVDPDKSRSTVDSEPLLVQLGPSCV